MSLAQKIQDGLVEMKQMAESESRKVLKMITKLDKLNREKNILCNQQKEVGAEVR